MATIALVAAAGLPTASVGTMGGSSLPALDGKAKPPAAKVRMAQAGVAESVPRAV